jgi:hypothetical protein
MKTITFFTLFFALFFPALVKSQVACASGSDQEICSANIPADAIVVQGNQTYSNVSLACFWVCAGDSLTLDAALDCSVYLEPKARLILFGTSNHVWAKSESKVEITTNSSGNILGILEDVIFIDEGTNTDETICGISSGISFDYMFAPADGCDLTSVTPNIALASVQFYPNPVNGKESILMTTTESFFGEIYLSDSFGRLVKKWKIEGQPSINLPLENTNPGVYLIHVPNTNLVKKIVVF